MYVQQVRLYHSKLLSGLPDSRVRILKSPVSSLRRPTEMMHLATNFGSSRIRMDKSNLNLTSVNPNVVKSALLSDIVDTIVEEAEEKINIVMKLDIEGHECRAILGSEETFMESANNDFYFIPMIVMEWRFGKEFKDVCRRIYLLRMARVLSFSGFLPFMISKTFEPLDENYADWPLMDMVWVQGNVSSAVMKKIKEETEK